MTAASSSNSEYDDVDVDDEDDTDCNYSSRRRSNVITTFWILEWNGTPPGKSTTDIRRPFVLYDSRISLRNETTMLMKNN